MTAPAQRTHEAEVQPVVLGADLDSVIFQAPYAATVTAVTYVPAAAITGANTNTRLGRLVNKGQSGAGSTVVASLQFDSGINAVADDEKAITLSATAANLVLAAGDTLIWQSVHVGTGIADPGGLVRVTYTRSDASA